jgi:hypothetical protein
MFDCILLFIFNLNENLTFFPIYYFMLFFEFRILFYIYIIVVPTPKSPWGIFF